MSAPPTGVVALAFTDVQGSTQLWERQPVAMRHALELHDALARKLLAECGGYEVKSEGDSFMVVFSGALAAVRWCLALQKALLEVAWPPEIVADPAAAEARGLDDKILWRGLRVRMGVHLGEPVARENPTTGRMDYFGPVVNRAARVMAAGHGGQIVVTGAVWDVVEDQLEGMGVSAENTGEHKLRDIEATDRLFAFVPFELVGRVFPPLKTVAIKRTNITPAATSFVGRAQSLQTIDARFEEAAAIVSLVGPGGTGKTRLALRYAERAIDRFAGGVWLVPLAEARNVAEICAALGAVLSVPLTAGKTAADVVDQLGHALAGRGSILLVLDNFEQLVDHAAETVGRWRSLAPEARFLVTTQETLRLEGESVYDLEPLSGAADGRDEAVQLFVERARAVRPGWTMSETDAPSVEKIVRELDGIPLAIELAASRIGVLTPAKILERLPRRFDLLGGANRGAPSRQGTLRGAIDWSWSLLKPWEQDALAQASIFRGGFTLEAAEAVIDLSAHPGAPWVLDVVESLRGKSLLRSWEQIEFPGEPRFGMYSNIMQYAAEKLVVSGKAPATMARHEAFFLDAANAWADGVDGEGGLEKLQRLAVEFENVAAVLRSAADLSPATKDSAARALRAIRALDPVLSTRGPFAVHLDWLDRSLASADGLDVDPALRAHVLELRGRARRLRGRTTEAASDLEAAVAAARTAEDRAREGRALGQRAWVDYELGSLDSARRLIDSAVVASRAGEDQGGEAINLNIAGFINREADRLDEARRCFESSMNLHRRLGSKLAEAVALRNLGSLHHQQGRLAEALPCYERALAIYREFGARVFEGNTVGVLASLYAEEGDSERARQSFERALSISREVGNRRSHAIFLGNLGILELVSSQTRVAKAVLERAEIACREIGDGRSEGLYAAFLGGALAELDDEAASENAFARAETLLAELKDRFFAAAAAVLRALLDLSKARKLAAGGDANHAARLRESAATRLANAERDAGTGALTSRSDDVRLAASIVRRSLSACRI